MNNRFLISFFLIWCSFIAISQKDIPFDKRLFADDKVGFDEATKNIKLGDFYFFDGRDEFLPEALSHFLKAQAFNPNSSILNYKIGICYLYSSDKTKSLSFLQFAHTTNPSLNRDLPFYLGQSYQINGNYNEAITFYKQYLASLKPNEKRQQVFTAKKIEESKNGIELTQTEQRVWIDNLGEHINTEYSEFSPVISADNKTLFFTTRRPDSEEEKKDKLNNYFEDIYYSTREYNEDWSPAKDIGAPINTESHDATVGLSPDGKSILTYQGISANNGDIFIAKQRDDGTWKAPETIGENINSKHHESSATLSFDEKTLFFVSDQPNGFGQHDIYVSTWNDRTREWNKAENIGPTINTAYEEKGVFYHVNTKTLYFSSDGHKNIGGLDIFKTTFNEDTKEWSIPENIGHPINTPDDDIYFVVTGDGRYAYYSSNKPGGYGEKDLYRITFLGPEKEPAFQAPALYTSHKLDSKKAFIEIKAKSEQFLLQGTVTNGISQEGVLSKIHIINSSTNKRVKIIETHPDGSFATLLSPNESYAITATGNEFTIDSKNIKNASENDEIEMNFELFPPTANELSAGNSFTLRNIYFDFNEANLDHVAFNSQSQIELDLLAQFLKKNPTIIIELSGHTDSRGKASYNLELSGKRALISKEYLIAQGIDERRIKASGYGEYRPEVTEEEIKLLKSKELKEEAHQRNRRTVVTILSK